MGVDRDPAKEALQNVYDVLTQDERYPYLREYVIAPVLSAMDNRSQRSEPDGRSACGSERTGR